MDGDALTRRPAGCGGSWTLFETMMQPNPASRAGKVGPHVALTIAGTGLLLFARVVLTLQNMHGASKRAVYGAVAGAIGAACMTPLRLLARRHGVIDKTVSQTAEEWLASRSRARRIREPAFHHALDQILHVGYGAALGIAYALIAGKRRGVGTGHALGVATWLMGSWVLMPALGAKRPPWRKRWTENAVDLVAHDLFGLVTALVSHEMMAQTTHRPTSDGRRYLARSG